MGVPVREVEPRQHGRDPEFGKVNVRVRANGDGDGVVVDQIPLPEMPGELQALFEETS